ncbi:hypothetical protein DICVIV_02516 [Dictyocaulus viviparus]|uniref:Uncharacterized protein n=1 Tax=Dictyocaulus viviparus TaxID=29172 RepID=A0A0D8Y385_DICVI|nr:hypothetical protein DICVIV_02516 [Dictyocaulus viviparus]
MFVCFLIIVYSSDCKCRYSTDELYRIPPDPKTSNSSRKTSSPPRKSAKNTGDRTSRCLFDDIDCSKLLSIICGHPSGRCTALLLQSIRQQVTVAASSEYSRKALEWIIKNDVLLLNAKKNSLLVRVLQADGVESREQIARLINTIASYTNGREYLFGHIRGFVNCIVPVLRGRRLPLTTQEQLIATIQKISIRPSCQRELLQYGIFEWVVNFLEGKATPYAVEYACSLAINLSLNLACSLFNSLVLVWLGCSRVRLRAKDTRLFEVLNTRNVKKICPLCDLHIPYLLAVIAGGRQAFIIVFYRLYSIAQHKHKSIPMHHRS